MTMIPKILHFIWIGNKKMPEYAKATIEKFKQLNKDFDINIVNYDNCYEHLCDYLHNDQLFFNAFIKALNDKRSTIDTLQKFLTTCNYNQADFQKLFFDNCNIFYNIYVTIADYLRFDLLTKYGGIYCDLDCYPLKSFDDNILSEPFCVECNYKENCHDLFCIGNTLNNAIDMQILKKLKIQKNSLTGKMYTQQFYNLQQKFKSLDFDYIDNNLINYTDINNYIYHFYIGSKFE